MLCYYKACVTIKSSLYFEWQLFIVEINPTTLDLNLLRICIAVWETRSISRAAEIVGLSQPAASNALTRLRAATGDSIFVRSKNGMTPTTYAEQVLPALKHHMDGLLGAFGVAETFDPQTSDHHFRLSLSGLGELIFLPKLLKAAHQRAPSIRFENVQVSLGNLEHALLSENLDCAIGMIDVSGAGVISHDLFQDRFVAVAGEALKHPPSDIAELRAHRIAVSAPGASYGHTITQLIKKNSLSDNVSVKLASFGAISQLLETLPVVAIVPGQFAVQLAHIGNATILPIELDQTEPVVRLVWHERTSADPACVWLRSVMFELFQPDSK